MQRSTDRILTTHVGSLVRTRAIIDVMKAKTLGQAFDEARAAQTIRDGVKEVVRKQVEIGIDIPSDGEYGRRGFTSYIHERMSGLEPRGADQGEIISPQAGRAAFPEFSDQYNQHARTLWMLPEVSMDEVMNTPANVELFRLVAPIAYTGQSAVQGDIANFRAALDGLHVADAFITAITPTGRKSDQNVLEFYPSIEAYYYAVADALRTEYRAITDAGFIVQLDYAALNPHNYVLIDRADPSDAELRKGAELGVEVVNHALQGIPEDLVRYHHCWGSGNTPHTTDVPLRDIIDLLLKINAQAYAIEAANPRHEHEWMVWQDVKLPEGKILIPGVISQSTNVVEHPELIAWRLQNYASVVGKENVIAGADCGFSQFWDMIRVHPSVQWAKLSALVEGAAIASRALWSPQPVAV
jgi:5-methyltetrahydropteroyltriglutamate--homocysteine methyltransferase